MKFPPLLISSILCFVSATSYATPDNSSPPNQKNPVDIKQQRAINADVFTRQGKYESDSSFNRRQTTRAKAEEFFTAIHRDNCIAKIDQENTCYRATLDGFYQIYEEGIAKDHGRWKRVNNALCIGISCRPVSEFSIYPYTEYKAKFPFIEAETEAKSVSQLLDERLEHAIRSITCYKCSRDRWETSLAEISRFRPNCTAELNKHRLRYGDLNITQQHIFVTEKDEGRRNSFQTAVITIGPDSKTTAYVDFHYTHSSEICNPQFTIDKTF